MPARYDSDQLLALHIRLLAGDRTASEEVASLLLAPLAQEISHKSPQVDEQIIYDGVTEAILDYCARPRQFEEKRGVPLGRFLRMAASRNVANSLRGKSDGRRGKKRRDKNISPPLSNLTLRWGIFCRKRRPCTVRSNRRY
jgi:hypothetical protein